VSDIFELFGTSYFRAGLRLGIVALAVGWALRLIIGRFRPPLPITGILIAAVTVGGLYTNAEVLGPLVPALAVILVGMLIVRLTKAPRWAQIPAAIPGAVWLATASLPTTLTWVRVLTAILVPVGGFLANDFEKRHERMGLGVIFFALATLGAFAAVPDTEQILVITAAMLPLTLLAWPKVAASLGSEGSFLAIAVLIWVVAAGGEGRPSSIIGSAACLGLLLIEPAIVLVKPALTRRYEALRSNWLGAVVASIPQLILVLVCSRVAARFETELPAFVVVLVAYLVTFVVGVVIASRTPEAVEDPLTSV
jgi:hypothetical protein